MLQEPAEVAQVQVNINQQNVVSGPSNVAPRLEKEPDVKSHNKNDDNNNVCPKDTFVSIHLDDDVGGDDIHKASVALLEDAHYSILDESIDCDLQVLLPEEDRLQL